MAIYRFPDKHPSAIRAYPIAVAGLGSNTIGVVSSAVTVGAGMVVDSTTASGNTVTVVLSAGTAAIDYQIETTINLSNGERLIFEFNVKVVDN